MIHQVSGDILLSKAQLIAHGVAPNDEFSQGLALALRSQWPAMYKDFRHFIHTDAPEAGELWVWGGPSARIAALFTQEPAPRPHTHPGQATHHNVNRALRALRQEVVNEGYQSVALPRLATGVGGMDWPEVEALIQHHLGDLGVPVYVYSTYRSGVQADEPGL